MIEIGLPLDVPHGVIPTPDVTGTEHGDTVAVTPNPSLAASSASTTALKIHLPNDPYQGTVFDKDIWTAPDPDDGDKVCEWAQNIAAAQPQGTCDQWNSDDWDAWADAYGDNDCDIPKCGENFPARLEPMYQSSTGESYLTTVGHSTAKTQLALPVIFNGVAHGKLNLAPKLPTLSVAYEDSSPGSVTPRKRLAKVTLRSSLDVPSLPVPLPNEDDEDEDVSSQMEERNWNAVQTSRPSPAVFVMCSHAVTLAVVETSLKGGDAQSFKEEVLANAGAVNPLSKALLETHVFVESEPAPEDVSVDAAPQEGLECVL
mmetsp:Transcript_38450/g.77740  ORF Transcript_38450/g.77740 Transcript_38450/m.77740 type:complete len:315 (-) Transcript_38450:230-1174(-)